MKSPGSEKQDAADRSSGVIAARQMVTVGSPVIVEGPSPWSAHAAYFEDDGETGYYYALECKDDARAIVDAMQIYVVAGLRPTLRLEILWSGDATRAALMLDREMHALFDFAVKRGYCRKRFPPAGAGWSRDGLTDDVAAGFK